MMVSGVHQVCKKGFYIAIISTNVETNNPEKEIQAGLSLLGSIREKFINISNVYEPDNSKNDGLFITKSSDAQSHFESLTQDVMDLYEKIEGKPIPTDVDMSELEDY